MITPALVLGFLLLILQPVRAVDSPVDVGYAKYQGQALPSGVSQWLGMRFAAPPVGDLRFSPPQDPNSEEQIQPAVTNGPYCLATDDSPTNNETSEDCLFLNLYAPTNATPNSKLPVFFWIQGGGFNQNANANYNGTGLVKAADMDMIVVMHNYRVGPYGFLAGKGVESLNNGLKDQIKALEWVQKHISKFGGDPDHVTLFGASAGAASITLHLTAYGGTDQGLFHAAGAQSQSFATMLTIDESQFAYDNLVIRTGCASEKDTLACLRNKDAMEIQEHNFNTPFPGAQNAPLYMYGPTLDNDLVPDYTLKLFEDGKFIKVPTIFGDDTDEGTIFVYRNVSTIEESDTFIKDQFPFIKPEHLNKLHDYYPNRHIEFPGTGEFWKQCAEEYGEIRYICPGIQLSSLFAKYGVENNWNYHYAVVDPEQYEIGNGVQHTIETVAIWGPDNVNGVKPESYSTPLNSPIIPVIQSYWTSFAKSYDPNTHRLKGSPEWKNWAHSEDYVRLFIKTNETRMEDVPGYQRERCEYISSIAVDIRL